MKKITLSLLAIMIAASTVMAADKAPVKKAKPKTTTAKTLKKVIVKKAQQNAKEKAADTLGQTGKPLARW